MSRSFNAHMDILPPAQQQLWPSLRPATKLGFTLYGGTAVALRLGHRASVDFDFFSEKPLSRESIGAALPFVAKATTLQDQDNAWVVLAAPDVAGLSPVKLSFFGAITFGRVGEPELTTDGVLRVAAMDDLMATKLKVVLQRAEAKDYRDIAAMLTAGVDLSRGLAAARLLFGQNFQPSESLKALSYFGDGDLSTLTTLEKTTLTKAADAVRNLPDIELLSKSLYGPAKNLNEYDLSL